MSDQRKFPSRKRGGCGRSVLASILVVVIVLGVVAYLFVVVTPSTFALINDGCAPIPIREAVPPSVQSTLEWLGIALPENIPPGSSGFWVLPRVPLDVQLEILDNGEIEYRVLNFSHRFDPGEGVTLMLNDVSLQAGDVLTLKTTGGEYYELTVLCK